MKIEGFAAPGRADLFGDRQIRLALESSLRIGPLQIDPSLRRITHDDGRVDLLQPRVMQVLIALIQADGKVLSRDDLLASCWAGRVVGEDAIDRVIGRLRRLTLGIGAGAFSLTTITKVGYRLERAVAAAAQQGPSICVLPFANLTDDPQQTYFGDGIAKDIITDLSKISSLFVTAQSTAFGLRDADLDVATLGRRLGVGHLLEGSVRKVGDQIRVTAQLIDVRSGGHVWAERYDRRLGDVFTVQDEIAQAVVGVLKLKLLPAEKQAIEQRRAGGDRLLVIGPVLGLNDELAASVLEPLRAALAMRLARDVAVAPQLADAGAEKASFSMDVVFHAASGAAQAAFVVRDGKWGGVLTTLRQTFRQAANEAEIDAVAEGVAHAIWKHLALGTQGAAGPKDPPLHVRMHNASQMLDPPGATWIVNRTHLNRLRTEQPTDARLGLLWAMNEFGRVTVNPGVEALRRQDLTPLFDEVEHLALSSLPAVGDDPILTLAAAELLFGVHRGHEDLAESLATAALASSAAFAAALPLLGQISAFRGRLEDARRHYDEGLGLCEPGSAFELFLQVKKSATLVAMEDQAGVAAAVARMVVINPDTLKQFGLLFLSAGDTPLGASLQALAAKIGLADARRTIAYLHYRVAANFGTPRHRANIMRGPLIELGRRFGPDVASDEIWRELPEELRDLRGRMGAQT